MKRMLAILLALCLLFGQVPATILASEGSPEEYPIIEENVETAVELDGSRVWKYFRFVPQYSELYYFEGDNLDTSHKLFDRDMNVLYDDEGAASYVLTAGETYIYATTNREDSDRLSYRVTVYPYHSYSETARVPGTCTEPGSITYTCNCGASYTEAIAPSHNMVNGVCTVCGEGFLASGRCGSNLTWDLRQDDTLTIQGEGRMWDYYPREHMEAPVLKEDANTTGVGPWEPYRSQIRVLEIGEYVTHIGENAFEDLTVLEQLVIPGNVVDVGNGAFRGATHLEKLLLSEGIESLGSEAFGGCTALREVRFPASVIQISSCLSGCTGLDQVIFDGNAPKAIPPTSTGTVRP